MTKLKTLPYTDYPNVAKALSEVVWSSYHAGHHSRDRETTYHVLASRFSMTIRKIKYITNDYLDMAEAQMLLEAYRALENPKDPATWYPYEKYISNYLHLIRQQLSGNYSPQQIQKEETVIKRQLIKQIERK
ncbi:hypothetical protein [Limosilactobacillus fermentum]|uniref:hypothetical protein n=1 Tax=Limosilactobacillus fermentum TaxID=1613 RepID=UPI0022EBADEE|nr:hypothetical protein [Limosilactobacillus fermentum]MDA3723690.1 hypothetical protein [Limosilactobacillus fermentum]MDA3762060.1 hypothetical protein [Limosilactobacillus fermentum]